MTVLDRQLIADTYRERVASLKAARAQQARYQADPVAWVQEKAKAETWSKIEQIMQSVAGNQRTAVQSCHGIGKSFTAARLATWWIDAHPPGEAFVVTSAPTFAQVAAILWREIGRAHVVSGAPGRILTTEWKMPVNGRDELVAFGRKPADHDVHGFQGIHARYVLVIFDEACGIPRQLFIAGQALATNTNSRLLAIGNPDDPQSEMARLCKDGSSWNVIRVSAFDTPNLSGEPISSSLAELLVDRSFVDAMLEICGGDEDHPIYRSKVLGEFTADMPDALIPYSLLARMRAQEVPDAKEPHVLGVDVGGGGDPTVIRERIGQRFGRVWRKQTPEQSHVEAMVLEAIDVCQQPGVQLQVNVDEIGIGWGVPSNLRDKAAMGRHKAEVRGVNVADGASESDAYANLKAEIQWSFRLGLQRGEWCTDGLDDQTMADLSAPKWRIGPGGVIQVEPKDETKKRLGRSPDDGDALLLSTYQPPFVMPKARTLRFRP